MSTNFEPDAGAPDAAALERLSALVDGELDSAAVHHACRHWQVDPDARATWHAYHLIGDVLRSEDLACTSARDTAFLAGLRVRLQAEPVVLAPQPVRHVEPVAAAIGVRATGGARRGRWAWVAPSAVAASVVAVAGVLVLNGRPGGPSPIQPAAELAQTNAATGGTTVAAPLSLATMTERAPDHATEPVTEPPSLVADGQLIRSARLDRYLAAHKQFAGSSALGVPSAFLRNATATESER